MNKTQMIKAIMEREGKKSQVKIGDLREIFSIIETMLIEYNAETYQATFVDKQALAEFFNCFMISANKKTDKKRKTSNTK